MKSCQVVVLINCELSFNSTEICNQINKSQNLSEIVLPLSTVANIHLKYITFERLLKPSTIGLIESVLFKYRHVSLISYNLSMLQIHIKIPSGPFQITRLYNDLLKIF